MEAQPAAVRKVLRLWVAAVEEEDNLAAEEVKMAPVTAEEEAEEVLEKLMV